MIMNGTDEDQDHDRDDAAASLTQMKYLKKQENTSDDSAAKTPNLDRQLVLALSSISSPNTDAGAHIRLYSYYVIDHSKLPVTASDQLKSIRLVMVSEKCKNRVEVRYPSMCSLRAHFSGGEYGRMGLKRKTMPALDEEFVMEPEVAEEVLYRRVQSHEIGENRDSWGFWVVGFDEKVGVCLSVLKSGGRQVKWGQTRKVKFLKEVEEKKDELAMVENEDLKENDEDNVKSNAVKENCKRRCIVSADCEKKKMRLIKSSSGRWSKERYRLAEVNMLKIMKEKGAVFGRPIMRAALRMEARKLIGDTGLLDHLLKHMAGKVAPGGQERFRRRHNADGAMEYWLESADLVDIRNQAGVEDPYWTPPPGWTPGDNPIQDPVCARDIRQLKQDIAKISRDMQELLSKRQEDDMAIVATPTSCITSRTLEHNSFLHPLKEMFLELVNKKAAIEEQLKEISHSLSGMEQEIEKLKTLEEPNKPESDPKQPLLTESTTQEQTSIKEVEQKKEETERISNGTQGNNKTGSTTAQTTPEGKAAMIARLKSGFRICKPQGTFLWPNMVMSPPTAAVVPLNDLLVVSTPPSASSSTTTPSLLFSSLPQCEPLPTPPIKPFAEKPWPATKPSNPGVFINLNELPTNQNEPTDPNMPCVIPSKKQKAMKQHEEVERQKIKREFEQKCRGGSSSASSSACLSAGAATWLALTTKSSSHSGNSRRG